MLLQKILLALLGVSLIIGLVVSEDVPSTPLTSTSKGFLFNYEDSTKGVGDFASFNKIVRQGPHSDARILSRLADISFQRMDHGSGQIERDMIIRSDKQTSQNISPDYNYEYSLANALVSSNLVFSPQVVSIGTGYYADHPVKFNSLLGEKTEIKNHASETSMSLETISARAIKKELEARVEDDHYDAEWLPSVGLGNSQLNINESVVSGTAHLGMLQGRRAFDYDKSALYDPKIYVDEVYTGTFNLATKMNLTVPKYSADKSDDWLPCCYGGYLTMPTYYQTGSKGFGSNAKDIFDCTCPKVVGGA